MHWSNFYSDKLNRGHLKNYCKSSSARSNANWNKQTKDKKQVTTSRSNKFDLYKIQGRVPPSLTFHLQILTATILKKITTTTTSPRQKKKPQQNNQNQKIHT